MDMVTSLFRSRRPFRSPMLLSGAALYHAAKTVTHGPSKDRKYRPHLGSRFTLTRTVRYETAVATILYGPVHGLRARRSTLKQSLLKNAYCA